METSKHVHSGRFSFLRLQNQCGWWQQPWNEKMLPSHKESYDKHRQHIKTQRYHFANKGSYSHVWMWELDNKKGWAPKNWCYWTMVLEKTPESPLDSKEIKLVNLEGKQSWIFIGRTDAEAPVLQPPDTKSWLVRKDPDAKKDWGQEEKGTAEDEMVG